MTATNSLNNSYCSFFSGCASLAIAPYKHAFIAGSGGDTHSFNPIMGLLTCGLLTAVPILPLMSLVTIGLAVSGAFIGALTTFGTYPIALGIDACSGSSSSPHSYR